MNPAERDRLRLESICRWRSRPRRDLSLSGLAEQVAKQFVKPHRQLGSLTVAWREVFPPHIVERSALVSFVRGVLTVQVADSVTNYELDRLLRGGAERHLKAASPATLRRIKVKVGPLD